VILNNSVINQSINLEFKRDCSVRYVQSPPTAILHNTFTTTPLIDAILSIKCCDSCCHSVIIALFSSSAALIFTARCTLVQSAVLLSHVVCLSVRLSVTLVDCDHIGWNTPEIISPLVSVGRSLSEDPNIMGLLQGEHP